MRRVKRGVLRIDLPAGLATSGAQLDAFNRAVGATQLHVRAVWQSSCREIAELHIQRPREHDRPVRYGFKREIGSIRPIPPDTAPIEDDYTPGGCIGTFFTTGIEAREDDWWWPKVSLDAPRAFAAAMGVGAMSDPDWSVPCEPAIAPEASQDLSALGSN